VTGEVYLKSERLSEIFRKMKKCHLEVRLEWEIKPVFFEKSK